ncbi:multiple sugar transport system permease protein [Paenibacillus phyllosphaerae]|uniref:Multiple sugar transport system permease protein n=1 Tax=Paenibacillus phyllosphaerae TaxID=274593 RepID=A0A7W5B3Z9_9BACL|nr:sugar ABC transporter permease [Paenibacillus phyllosphaerae]MBB3113985.1 multiple sugar transport system permease protein [Paenibacillus phyllosphaerae]
MSKTIENLYAPPLAGKSEPLRQPWHQSKLWRRLKPYLYLLPAVALLGIWMYRPLLYTFYLAFHKWSMVPGTAKVFVGFDNFSRLLQNKSFVEAIGNTVFYTVGLLPFSIVIPLILAVVTDKMNDRMKNFYRALFFIPMILAPVSVSAIWRWLFHPSNGVVNHLLLKLGLIEEQIAFFSDASWARWIILFITGWKMIGFSTIMFAAALTSINREYYEAASIDGASSFRQFLNVTVPLMSPMILFMLTMSILFSSQWTFAYIDILTTGGPYGSSTNIYYEMYRFAFSNLNVGVSSAAAMLFFLAFGVIALALNAVSRKFAFYDN